MSSAFILTGEQAEEYRRLLVDYESAMERARAVLAVHGMESTEFRQADAESGALWARLRELQGMAGKHWMA